MRIRHLLALLSVLPLASQGAPKLTAHHEAMAMYHQGKDGKFVCVMEIAYTRRK